MNACRAMFSNAIFQLMKSRYRSQKMKSVLSFSNTSSWRMFTSPAGDAGSGAGKGGGAGGSIREAGGGLGKFAAANEEGYFFEKQRRQLQKLKDKLKKSPNPTQKPEE